MYAVTMAKGAIAFQGEKAIFIKQCERMTSAIFGDFLSGLPCKV
jgi:hypothetical protein